MAVNDDDNAPDRMYTNHNGSNTDHGVCKSSEQFYQVVMTTSHFHGAFFFGINRSISQYDGRLFNARLLTFIFLLIMIVAKTNC
ncbi:hypothetical protein T05_3570 [Trichinella murrelli]|uniref:Uncharacterized protein n=1 Tax=Trichinella murrelli TaxID=144512 RepID=A0A0V0U567_9BILA|nr:hypothetical protein T05_3570 [Trichinella murrelli]